MTRPFPLRAPRTNPIAWRTRGGLRGLRGLGFFGGMPIVASIYLGGNVTVIATNSLKPNQEVQISGDQKIPDGTYMVAAANSNSFQFSGAGISGFWNQTPSQGGMFAPVQSVVPVATSTAAAVVAPVASSGDWFTDPTQGIISGVPNIAIVAGAGLLLLLMVKHK